MASDNPCIKPEISIIDNDPIVPDCTIEAAPPPFSDCKDIDLPVPGLTDGGSSGSAATVPTSAGVAILPVVLKTDMADCSAMVRRIQDMGGGYVEVGATFEAFLPKDSCACEGIFAGVITWVVKSTYTGLYEFTDLEAPSLLPFELTSTVVSTGDPPWTTTAVILKKDGAGFINTLIEIDVVDMLGQFPCGREGDRGYAACTQVKAEGGGTVWEITDMKPKANRIMFTLDGDLDATDPDAAVTVTDWIDGGEGSSTSVTVSNTMKFAAAAGAVGTAFLNSACDYIIDQLECNVT